MRINSSFVLRDIHGVCLLVPIRVNDISNDVIALNKTAAIIFQRSKSASSIYELCKLTAEGFTDKDTSTDEIIEKLQPYVESLINKKLILMEE